jgi:DNA invertase Pin-like site-specific DNA recombinase
MVNKNAVIYIRVSNKDQDEERQINDAEYYVKDNGINLKKTFIEKISGYKIDYNKRSGFTDLIDYVDDNDISHIIVSELSRIGRRLIETLLFIRDCTEKGICLHILKERIVTLNKDGTKNTLHTNMISMFATVAEIESEQISYRVQSSLQTKYADGRGFNARVIGYKRDENGRAIIDVDEAPIIREIFKLHQENMSLFKMVNYLNSKYSNIKKFSEGGLRSILRNKLYTGERTHNNGKHIIKIKPIISLDTYNKSSDLLENRKRSTLDTVHINPFASIIFCELCGNKLHQFVAPSSRNNKYKCPTKDCRLKAVNRPHLIDVIKKSLLNQSNNTWFKRDKEKAKENLDILIVNKGEISKELKSLKRNQNLIFEYLFDETISKELFKERNYKIEKKQSKLLKKLDTIEIEITNTENFIDSKVETTNLDKLTEFKKVVQKHIQSVKVNNKFVVFKIKGGFKHIDLVYRGSELFMFNRGTLTHKSSLKEDVAALRELLNINNDLSQKELNEMLKEFELDYLYSESN